MGKRAAWALTGDCHAGRAALMNLKFLKPPTVCKLSHPWLPPPVGYEGYLGGAAAASRKVVVKPEERLFSWSSVTGQVPTTAQR